ncbi:hypothetical protein LPW26_00845 [Rhodopseudomonas sp. HC1]|uniref:hypothetical protein n=1 Tax=Rhodopseudomonas infernalis TaxID=2897386 RepID=UPI001EE89270|nr:hypothetical protein [Rhodopseudomonas infernalis]MCG6203169.1 hypothetical protein [Rhodopseudomonas infernalis]
MATERSLMPSPRSRTPAVRKAGTSPARDRTRPVAARKATLAACAKPVDATIRIDPSDPDGQERAARVTARKAKAEAAAAEGRPAGSKRASNRSAGDKSATKKPAAKKPATKKAPAARVAAKTSTPKNPARKTALRRKTAADADASDDAAQLEAAATDLSEQTITSDAIFSESATDDATDTLRRRGPSGVTRNAVERLDDPPPETGLRLIDRVSRAVEREITQIEVIVGGHHLKPAQRTEAERRARTLASLARTLSDLRKLRSDDDRKRVRDDDAIPRDLDGLRRALSLRLEQLVAGSARLPAAGDE